jgi:hypothetical protein
METDYREIVFIDFRQGKRIVSHLKHQDQSFCLPSLLLNAYRRQITRGLKLTTRLQQVPRFSTCGSVPPPPVCLYWRVQDKCYLYFYFLNCNWVDTSWHYNSTHLHTNSTQNTENGTYVYITIKNCGVRAVPYLCEFYPGICLTAEEKARINVRVVKKCPDIPVAVVQYTFTH